MCSRVFLQSCLFPPRTLRAAFWTPAVPQQVRRAGDAGIQGPCEVYIGRTQGEAVYASICCIAGWIQTPRLRKTESAIFMLGDKIENKDTFLPASLALDYGPPTVNTKDERLVHILIYVYIDYLFYVTYYRLPTGCLLVALDAHMFAHNGHGPGTRSHGPRAPAEQLLSFGPQSWAHIHYG